MSNNDESEFTVYGSIGVAIFAISVGIVYLLPSIFPEGTLYVVAGILIALVNILNALKGITYSGTSIAIAVISILIGADKILDLELKFLPIILILLGVLALFRHIKKT